MNVLAWVLFGLIVGIVNNALDPQQGGQPATILLGVLGAMVGGFLASVVLGLRLSGFNLTSFVLAAVASLGLLYMVKMVERARRLE